MYNIRRQKNKARSIIGNLIIEGFKTFLIFQLVLLFAVTFAVEANVLFKDVANGAKNELNKNFNINYFRLSLVEGHEALNISSMSFHFHAGVASLL